MPSSVKPVRTYSTKLRHEQADLTRRRVLEAARILFVAAGFAGVTMQEIAREAGVAYQTVYSQFGNKLNLALELCASEFPHVGPTVGLLVAAAARDDAESWLAMMGTFARRLYEPCAEILKFMRESGDPNLLGRYDEIQMGRFERLQPLGPQLERSGRLRAGLSAQQAVELVWTLSAPDVYEHLVLGRGWSPQQFEDWLNSCLADMVLVET